MSRTRNAFAQCPLSGCDWFLHTLSRPMEKSGDLGSICRLVLDLDAGPDTRAINERLSQDAFLQWLAGVRLGRRVAPMVPKWRSGPEPTAITITEHKTQKNRENALHELARHRHLDPTRPPGLALDLLHTDDGVRLVLTWHHTLMDARGAELLLEYMTDHERVQDYVPVPKDNNHALRKRLVEKNSLIDRMPFGRKAARHFVRIGQLPFTHLSGPPETTSTDPEMHWRTVALTQEETRQCREKAGRTGGALHPSLFHLAANVQAIDALRAARGLAPQPHVVPVTNDQRRCGARGPILGNHVSFHIYRIEPDVMANMQECVGYLSGDMKQQMRAHIADSCNAMMRHFRRVPAPIYDFILRGPTKNRIATFTFGDLGNSCQRLKRFFGAGVLQVRHLPPAIAPPGISIAASTYADRLTMTIAWHDTTLTDEESMLWESVLRKALLD